MYPSVFWDMKFDAYRAFFVVGNIDTYGGTSSVFWGGGEIRRI